MSLSFPCRYSGRTVIKAAMGRKEDESTNASLSAGNHWHKTNQLIQAEEENVHPFHSITMLSPSQARSVTNLAKEASGNLQLED